MNLKEQTEVAFVSLRGTRYWFTGLITVAGGLVLQEMVMAGSLDHMWRYVSA